MQLLMIMLHLILIFHKSYANIAHERSTLNNDKRFVLEEKKLGYDNKMRLPNKTNEITKSKTDKDNVDDGSISNISTTQKPLVVMPGLPGLPGMPGLPGDGGLQRSKKSYNPDYINCTISPDLPLCNLSVIDNKNQLKMDSSQHVPVYQGPGYSKWPANRIVNINDILKYQNNNDNILQTKFPTNNMQPSSSKDPSKIEDFTGLPSLQKNGRRTMAVDKNDCITGSIRGCNDTNHIPINIDENEIVVVNNYRYPIGPNSRTINFQAISMNVEDSRIFIPHFNFPRIPRFPLPLWPGNVIMGSPGTPGNPGMPGTPGASVISTLPLNTVSGLVAPPNVMRPPARVPGILPTAPVLRPPQPLPQYPVGGTSDVQSSSGFYSNRPGYSTSSQAVTGINSYQPTYPQALPPNVLAPGNPVPSRPVYPSYPGFQSTYNPGYPLQQYPTYPIGYPVGYPYGK